MPCIVARQNPGELMEAPPTTTADGRIWFHAGSNGAEGRRNHAGVVHPCKEVTGEIARHSLAAPSAAVGGKNGVTGRKHWDLGCALHLENA